MMNYIVLYVGNAFIHAFPKDFMQSTDSTIRVGANATYQTPWLAELTGCLLYTSCEQDSGRSSPTS